MLHGDSEAIDLDSNHLGDGHHFPIPHLVPLRVLNQNVVRHQVGTFQPTALGECVSAHALEIKHSPVKRPVMGTTRGTADALTNGLTFLDTVLHFALLVGSTPERLAKNLWRKTC